MEIPEAAETEAAPAPEGAPEGAPETEAAPAPEALETPAQEAMPEEVLPEEPPAPKARPKGRPKGSKTINKKPKVVTRASTPEPEPRVETTPDIFEIIRQRQMAQFERKQEFYKSFLPIR